uniref:Uncharacterized protein LOC114349154 n=1 Tax=Diabrotica virgifera virgifera TaxID=50390 RepID=A0A6P7H1D9_DIAVI
MRTPGTRRNPGFISLLPACGALLGVTIHSLATRGTKMDQVGKTKNNEGKEEEQSLNHPEVMELDPVPSHKSEDELLKSSGDEQSIAQGPKKGRKRETEWRCP